MDFKSRHFKSIDFKSKSKSKCCHPNTTLKYLNLRDTKVQMLPKSIGKLQNLETLDLKRSLVSELPTEISRLRKLRYLVAYIENTNIKVSIDAVQAVKIHSGIGRLQSLQKLFKIEANNTSLIEELGGLGQLRKLEISKMKRENGVALCTTLEKMNHLQSLRKKFLNYNQCLLLHPSYKLFPYLGG